MISDSGLLFWATLYFAIGNSVYLILFISDLCSKIHLAAGNGVILARN